MPGFDWTVGHYTLVANPFWRTAIGVALVTWGEEVATKQKRAEAEASAPA